MGKFAWEGTTKSGQVMKGEMEAPHAEAVAATIKTEGAHFIDRLQSPEAQEAFTAFLLPLSIAWAAAREPLAWTSGAAPEKGV